MTNRRGRVSTALSVLVLTLALASCRHDPPRFEGLDPQQMPEDMRSDYALFAHRCSKCHSLARPLQSGITDDAFWADYVERMRLQPGSGISREDTTPILRFLHYLSSGQLSKRDLHPAAAFALRDGGDE